MVPVSTLCASPYSAVLLRFVIMQLSRGNGNKKAGPVVKILSIFVYASFLGGRYGNNVRRDMKFRFEHPASRWRGEGGYRQLLLVAFPLILSTGSWSIQHFVDRMFLTWYSPEAVAASMPAGILNFTVLCLFIGTANFTGTFVAQYFGSGNNERVGPSVWQGLYLSVIGTAVMLLIMPFSGDIFRVIGHDTLVQRYEAEYFSVLCLGAFPVIASAALSGFFIGRGKTWPVMWVNVISTAVNLFLDYCMIFGRFGFPEWGMTGAAVASVAGAAVGFFIYTVLVFRETHDQVFHTIRGWRFDRELFSRLMHFGFPSGVQFFLDVAGFTAFILLMGRLGTVSLAATNIAFNINTLAFMPMIGIGIAVSSLVGQNVGRGRVDLAERSVYSGFHVTFIYMAAIASLYVLVPGLFIEPFARGSDPSRFKEIAGITVTLLKFVAVYSIFDTLNIIFSNAIKGAGDTRFVMRVLVGFTSMGLVLPAYLVLVVFGKGIYSGWFVATAYVCIMGIVFFLRFLGGKWKAMKVIEETHPAVPPVMTEAPTAEFDV